MVSYKAVLLLLSVSLYGCVWWVTEHHPHDLHRPLLSNSTRQVTCRNSSRTGSVKKVVFWTSWFGDPHWTNILAVEREKMTRCRYKCEFSTNETDPLQFDALIFHGRDDQRKPKSRSPNQVYIMLMFESPISGESRHIRGGEFYNWSASYSLRSEIPIPYIRLKRKHWDNPRDRFVPALPQVKSHFDCNTTAVVAWVVSHCSTPSRREEYAKLLSKHIKVDIYGDCGQQCYKNHKLTGLACHEAIAQSGQYKFYLAFENSACSEYITEKPKRALQVGLVPIVYGGLSGSDYLNLLPPGSYIDVRDYPSPRHLADHLTYLHLNTSAYLGYHTWRLYHELGDRDMMCSLCTALYNTKLMSHSRNVDWGTFWDARTQCDGNLLEKVRGKGS